MMKKLCAVGGLESSGNDAPVPVWAEGAEMLKNFNGVFGVNE
jgi:hypothetical protein